MELLWTKESMTMKAALGAIQTFVVEEEFWELYQISDMIEKDEASAYRFQHRSGGPPRLAHRN